MSDLTLKGFSDGQYVDRFRLRDKLYQEDAITMGGMAILSNFPAADVVPVRHGHWEFEDDENMSWCTKAICTSCKQVVADNADLTQTWGKRLFLHDNLYCPRCGAKMDGGQDE